MNIRFWLRWPPLNSKALTSTSPPLIEHFPPPAWQKVASDYMNIGDLCPESIVFLDALASLEEPWFDITSTNRRMDGWMDGWTNGYWNHLICPVYAAQQSLHLIQHHSSTHLLIPIHQKMCTALPILLIIIHPFIYSSPFIQDPVSLKHPEAKHSSAHQGRINVRQCAHLRHILSSILSIVNHSETNHMLGRLQTFQFILTLLLLDDDWRLLKTAMVFMQIHFQNILRHLVNVWEMFNLS